MDLDLLEFLYNFPLVEREHYAFNIDVEYEKIHSLCSFFHIIGHSLEYSRVKNVAKSRKKRITKMTLYNPTKSNHHVKNVIATILDDLPRNDTIIMEKFLLVDVAIQKNN